MGDPVERSLTSGHLPDTIPRNAMRAALERELGGMPDGLATMPLPVADHDLLERIGAGAYGEVWLARNALGRLRAVKIVYRARFTEEHPYEREFSGLLKYEPVSRTHAGLVQILHAGRNDEAGYFYSVMELADNAAQPGEPYAPRTLRSVLTHGRRLPSAEAARLALKLAEALGHLHAAGLVHRDIKPGNVIFVEGQPKLADIGLVTDAGSAHSFVGTEGFIPPEGPGTPAADLFSLGKLLYESAAGRDRNEFPQLPVPLVPGAEGEALLELNEVMTRACEPDPHKRYTGTAELAADLNLFLAGRSLRRARTVERHFAQLKKFALAAGVVLVVAAVALWITKREEHRALDRARTESALRLRAEQAERATQKQLRAALFEQARGAVRSGEAGHRVHVLDALQRAAAIEPGTELRREAVAALALPDVRREQELTLPPATTCVALDPRFGRVALGRGDGAVELYKVPEMQLLATLPAQGGAEASILRWSPDGRWLALRRGLFRSAGDRDTVAEVWDVKAARRVLTLPPTPWGAFTFHPAQPRVLGGDAGDAVSLWDLESGSRLAQFSVAGLVHHLAFSPDGSRFVAHHRIGRVWRTSTIDAVAGTAQHSELSGWSDSLAWHPHGDALALATRTGEVILADDTGGRTVLGRHRSEVRTVEFTRDGAFLFSSGEDQEIMAWDLLRQRRAFSISPGSAQVQISADGMRCAVPAAASVLLYTIERATLHREMAGDLGGVPRHAAFSPDGRWLAVGGLARLGLWDLSGEAPVTIVSDGEFIIPVFSPGSDELFAIRAREHGRWRVGARFAPLPPLRAGRILSAQFTADALILGTLDGVQLIPRGDLASEGRRFGEGTVAAEVSRDGRWLAERDDASLAIFQLSPWQRRHLITFGTDLLDYRFTPAGDEIAVITGDGLTFADTLTGEKRRTFPGSFDRHARILFSPDGHTCWIARDAGSAALHDVHTFATLLPLPAGMLPLALSSDGRHLAVSVQSRGVQIWDLPALRAGLRELGLDWDD